MTNGVLPFFSVDQFCDPFILVPRHSGRLARHESDRWSCAHRQLYLKEGIPLCISPGFALFAAIDKYNSGYLATLASRRLDKHLDSVKSVSTQVDSLCAQGYAF